MADSERRVKVTLTADTTQYVEAIKRANKVTQKLHANLANRAGLSDEDARNIIAIIMKSYPIDVAEKVTKLLVSDDPTSTA